MINTPTYTIVKEMKRYHVALVNDHYTNSFTEFFPFCPELYYFSNFKDFNTVTQD